MTPISSFSTSKSCVENAGLCIYTRAYSQNSFRSNGTFIFNCKILYFHEYYICNHRYLEMEEVRKVIGEIEQKIAKMRGSMENVKSENETLKSEIDLLAEKLKLREEEAKEFKMKYDDLSQKSDHSEFKAADTDENQNAQIDALVREIDDCIGRLKE